MKLLLKNIFRYSFKNKWSFISLFALFFICLFLFITLGLLITNLSKKYDALNATTNPHDIVVNQNFDDDLQGNIEKAKFELSLLNAFPKNGSNVALASNSQISESDLNSLYNQIEIAKKNSLIDLRDFNSLNLIGEKDEKYKLIQYLHNYSIDTLKIYDAKNLSTNDKGEQLMPENINFSKILELANPNLDALENILARQRIVYFINKADWTSSEADDIFSSSKAFLDQLNSPNAIIDPLKFEQQNFNKYIKPFLLRNDDNFKIDNKVFKIIFTKSTSLGDSVAKYEDYTSYLTIVSPMYVKYNNKKIFDFAEFANSTKYQNFNLNSLNQFEFETFFRSIPDDYKIYIQNVPYLIIGTGLTPDFTYPIISFENLVVNYKNESVLYSNESGYSRAKNSWPTAEQENLILVKTSNELRKTNIDFAELLTIMNKIGLQYMPNFPPSINIAYLATDKNNIYTPSPIRVTFLEGVIQSINAVSLLLLILLLLIVTFVTTILLKKFIKENIRSLYVIIANGFNKFKTISTITIITLLPIVLATFFAFIVAFFLQVPAINIFESYWSIPITGANLSIIYIVPIAILASFTFTSLLIFSLTWISLKKPISAGINFDGIKIGPFANIFKNTFNKVNVFHKFRISIAFSSVSKLLFLSLISSLSMSSIIFFSSTFKTFDKSIAPTIRSNTSDFAINLATPTIQGGQYYGVDFNKIGQELENEKQEIVNPSEYSKKGDSYYDYYYNKTNKLDTSSFKTWSQLHYPQMDDLANSRTQLNYLFNKVENQFLLDVYLGGNFIPSNPWTDIIAKMIPVNQLNTSIQKTNDLNSLLISDNRMFKWSDSSKLNSNKIKKFNTTTSFGEKTNCILYITNDKYFTNNSKDNSPVIYLENNTQNNIHKLYQSYLDWKNVGSINEDPITSNVIKLYFDETLEIPSGPNITPEQEFIKSIKKISDNTLEINLGSSLDENNLLTSLGTAKFITYKSVYDKLFGVIKYSDNHKLEKHEAIVVSNIDNQKYLINKKNSSLFEELLGNGIKSSPLWTNFANFIFSDDIYQNYLYKLIYNAVPLSLENGDEPYVYVDLELNNNGIETKYKHDNSIEIYGIANDSQKIHLLDSEKNEIIFENDKILEYSNYSKKQLLPKDPGAIPIVINEYASKLYNLKVGSVIEGKAQNDVSRYVEGFKPEVQKLEVVAINDERKDAKFYTTMEFAQKMIGLATREDYNNNSDLSSLRYQGIKPIGDLNNKYNSFGGFNGIFTNDKNLSIITNSISLYSPGGTYLSIDTFKDDPNLIKIMNRILSSDISNENNYRELELLSIALGANTKQQVMDVSNEYKASNNKSIFVQNVIGKLNNKYQGYVYFSITEKPMSLTSERYVFNNLATIVNDVETTIIVLILVLSFLVLLITSYIIIVDFMKLILLLKTLGVSDFSNALNIFSVFIPVWLLSVIITAPLTFLVLSIFKEFAFVSMGILLNIGTFWFPFFISILSLAAIFAIIITFVTIILKKINVSSALRWN